jgi:hypothetical protein
MLSRIPSTVLGHYIGHVMHFAFRVFQGHWGLGQYEVIALKIYHSRTD